MEIKEDLIANEEQGVVPEEGENETEVANVVEFDADFEATEDPAGKNDKTFWNSFGLSDTIQYIKDSFCSFLI